MVLVHGASALTRDVEDLPEVDVRPYLGPLWCQVAGKGFAELVRGGLETSLKEICFAQPEVRDRTSRVAATAASPFLNRSG
jgi:hypothetical protein